MKKNKLFFAIATLIFSSCSASTTGSFVSSAVSDSSILSSSSELSESSISSSEEILPKKFSNPATRLECADPSIIRGDDGYFYVYPTSGDCDWNGDGKVTNSCGPILRSKDMIDFEYVGSVFKEKPKWSKSLYADLWAPDIVFRNNQYYYYYTLGVFEGDIQAGGIGVAVADYPQGPFVDYGKIFDGYDIDYIGPIDPAVVEDEDGRVYMIFGSFRGIYYYELNDDGLSVKSNNLVEDKTLLVGKATENANMYNYEGSYIKKMNGSYYFFASVGTCCRGTDSTYKVVCFKSDNLLGPYYDEIGNDAFGVGRGTTVISGYNEDGEKVGQVAGPGHNAVFEDDNGDYYIFYHGYSRVNTDPNYRFGFYDKLIFDENDFPKVENCVSSYGKEVDAPYFEE